MTTEDKSVSIPSESRCPECGTQPTAESVQRTKLSHLGYVHQDVMLVCDDADCRNEWTLGMPVGEFDRPNMANDLLCGSCGEWMLVHRIRRGVTLHLKCPNCYNFDRVSRESDDDEIVLVGYPQITGATAGCEPQGYSGEATDGDGSSADE